jgi:hypothetical protein
MSPPRDMLRRMVRIPLEAGNDHVERLAHEKDPVRAVLETMNRSRLRQTESWV